MKLIFLSICLLAFSFLHSQKSLQLKYDEPAQEWMEALPIGNGFLGAMVFGGVEEELLKLNHDEFWSGEPKDISNPEALIYKDSIADLVRQEKYLEADRLMRKMQGPFSQAYQPLADLKIKFDHEIKMNEIKNHEIEMQFNICGINLEKIGNIC